MPQHFIFLPVLQGDILPDIHQLFALPWRPRHLPPETEVVLLFFLKGTVSRGGFGIDDVYG
jgi:hypothetical protein